MTDKTDADPAPPTERTKREGHSSSEPKHEATAYLARGALVGRYVVIEMLGEGGMGVVYTAYDPELDRKLAIKLLQARSGGSASGGEQAWLLREAQALARLAHPNVVSVHDVGSLPGDRVFVAMELVDGLTLRKWLNAEQRSWRDVLPILIAAGKGLAAAHAAGLVHRDFKPDNVIVGNDGRVRVMDFGLARLRPGDTGPTPRISDLHIESKSPLAESLTVAGTVVGTPAYMAPEIYDGHIADATTDQFSFGVALFEALFHKRPFTREELRSTTPPRPKLPTDTKVPVRIQRAVLRAISLDPAQRYPTMDALLGELAIDPFAGRRRALVAAGIVAAGAAGVGAVVLLSRAAPVPCQGIEQRLAGVWDPAMKKKIAGAFVATRRSYAAKAFAELEHSLDAYTATWTTTSIDSCRATRVRRDQTEDVMSLRQTCLDQRLSELGALTQLLTDASPAIVDKAEKIGGELEPLGLCSNIAVLRAPGQPPPQVQAKLKPFGKFLADARANMIAGRYLPAMVAAKQAVDLAEAADFDAAKAEALLVRGAALLSTGNPQDAIGAFEDTAWTALRGRRDDLVVPASLMAAMVTSETLGKNGEAKIWLDLADATAARAGLDRVYEQKRYVATGMIAAHMNDNATAIAAHEKALEASKRTGGDAVGIWGDEVMLATTLTKAHVPAKAVPHFERAIELRAKIVGPDHPDIAMILTNLGAAYNELGMKDKARAAVTRAIAIREKAYGPNNPMLVTPLNNFADRLRIDGDYAQAMTVIERAEAIAVHVPGPEHPLYHQVETTRAEILGSQGKLAEARKLYTGLLAVEQKSHSEALPVTLGSRADLELRQHRFADAARFAEQAVGELERAGGSENSQLVGSLVTLGQAKLGLHDAGAAKQLLERAIALGEKAGASAFELEGARKSLATIK